MTLDLRLSAAIDALNRRVGRSMAWLILLAVLISAGNALVRKFLGARSNALLELQWYRYGAAFMLAAAYTLQVNEHAFPQRVINDPTKLPKFDRKAAMQQLLQMSDDDAARAWDQKDFDPMDAFEPAAKPTPKP